MELPEHIVKSITGETISAIINQPIPVPVVLSNPTNKNIEVIPLNQIAIPNKKFTPKKEKLEKYKSKVKTIEGPLITVKKQNNGFLLVDTSPYYLAAAKELKNKDILAIVV